MPKPDDEPLSRSEGALEFLQRVYAQDSHLVRLIEIANGGDSSQRIVCIVDGLHIVGTMVSDEAMAKVFDDDFARMMSIERPDHIDEEKWEWAKKQLHAHADEVRARHEWVDEVLESVEHLDDEEPIPGNLEADLINASVAPFVCLEDVRITSNANPRLVTKVPVMRVRASAVSAWWPLPVDSETGRSSYTLFEGWGDDDGLTT